MQQVVPWTSLCAVIEPGNLFSNLLLLKLLDCLRKPSLDPLPNFFAVFPIRSSTLAAFVSSPSAKVRDPHTIQSGRSSQTARCQLWFTRMPASPLTQGISRTNCAIPMVVSVIILCVGSHDEGGQESDKVMILPALR